MIFDWRNGRWKKKRKEIPLIQGGLSLMVGFCIPWVEPCLLPLWPGTTNQSELLFFAGFVSISHSPADGGHHWVHHQWPIKATHLGCNGWIWIVAVVLFISHEINLNKIGNNLILHMSQLPWRILYLFRVKDWIFDLNNLNPSYWISRLKGKNVWNLLRSAPHEFSFCNVTIFHLILKLRDSKFLWTDRGTSNTWCLSNIMTVFQQFQ